MGDGCFVDKSLIQALYLSDASGHRSMDTGNPDMCVSYGGTPCVTAVFSAIREIPVGVCVPAECTVEDFSNPATGIAAFVKFNLDQWDALLPNDTMIAAQMIPDNVKCGLHNLEPDGSNYAVLVLYILLGLLGVAALALHMFGLEYPWAKSKAGTKGSKKRSSGASRGVGKDGDSKKEVKDKEGPAMNRPLHTDTARPDWVRLLGAFSWRHNMRELVTTGGKRSGQFAALNFARVISMLLVILGHAAFSSNGIFQNESNLLPLPEGALNPVTAGNPGKQNVGYLTQVNWQIIFGAEFAVDAFLFMSGFLLVVAMKNRLEKAKGLTSWGAVQLYGGAVLHRWLRLVPALGSAILIGRYLVEWMGSGPLWSEWETGAFKNCDKYYWTNMLFVNNLVPWHNNEARECIAWTWYLGVDMQCFLIGAICVLVIHFNHRIGSALLATITVGCWIAGIAVTAHYNLTYNGYVMVVPGSKSFDSKDYSDFYYVRTWMRWPCYALGMGGAYLYYYTQSLDTAGAKKKRGVDNAGATAPLLRGRSRSRSRSRAKSRSRSRRGSRMSLNSLNDASPPRGRKGQSPLCSAGFERRVSLAVGRDMPWWGALLWLVAASSLILVIIYGTTTQYQDGGWSDATMTAYTALSRSGFCIGLGIVLHVVFLGKAGVVGEIMSWSALEPISKLTYSAYLLHYFAVLYMTYSTYQLPVFGVHFMIAQFCAIYCLAYVAAVVHYLLVEAPFANLEYILLRSPLRCQREACKGVTFAPARSSRGPGAGKARQGAAKASAANKRGRTSFRAAAQAVRAASRSKSRGRLSAGSGSSSSRGLTRGFSGLGAASGSGSSGGSGGRNGKKSAPKF